MRIEGLNLQIALRSFDDDGIVVGAVPFVYLLRCADGTLYVGHTNDLASREKTHNDGHGSTYTESRRPVEMVYAEEHSSLQRAIARERQVKLVAFTHLKSAALATSAHRADGSASGHLSLSITRDGSWDPQVSSG